MILTKEDVMNAKKLLDAFAQVVLSETWKQENVSDHTDVLKTKWMTYLQLKLHFQRELALHCRRETVETDVKLKA